MAEIRGGNSGVHAHKAFYKFGENVSFLHTGR